MTKKREKTIGGPKKNENRKSKKDNTKRRKKYNK